MQLRFCHFWTVPVDLCFLISFDLDIDPGILVHCHKVGGNGFTSQYVFDEASGETTDKSSRCVFDIEPLQDTTDIDPLTTGKFIFRSHPVDRPGLYMIETNNIVNRWIQCYCINQTSITSVFSFNLERISVSEALVMMVALFTGATLTKDVRPSFDESRRM